MRKLGYIKNSVSYHSGLIRAENDNEIVFGLVLSEQS